MTGAAVEYGLRLLLAAAGVVTLCVVVAVARRSRQAAGLLALGVVLGVGAALVPVGPVPASAVPRPGPTHTVVRPSYTPSPVVPSVSPRTSRSGIHDPRTGAAR